mmetsp:Transcript_13587/g.34291  ORF Transcript_13587/g.34291 Transcript_13587/m.34291 type:complete len:454 (+) Transcript_13587:340-1701(+)|eukprot:jgi/Tetstr1/462132/TSEL_007200.t1
MGSGAGSVKPMRCWLQSLLVLAWFSSSLAAAASSQQALKLKVPELTGTPFISSSEYYFRILNTSAPSFWSFLSRPWFWLFGNPRPPAHADTPVLDLGIIVSRGCVIKESNRRTQSQHAATIVEVQPGELLAAWFGGSWERNHDVSIWVSKFKDGQWSEEAWEVVPATNGTSTWNPVLFKVPATGEILLFYKLGIDPHTWEGRLVRSKDSGRSWGPIEALPSGLFGPVKNKPVVLDDGTIISGSSDELDWSVHIEYSKDNGYTWHKGNKLRFQGKILQPALFVNSDKTLGMLCRSNGPRINKRFVDNNAVLSISDRSGLHWSPGIRTNLPNPNSGIDAVRLHDGRLLVVYNPTNDGAQRARAAMSVAISRDNGLTWRTVAKLERVDVAPRAYLWPEYSYPSVIQTTDGLIHIVYTYTYEIKRRGHEGRENIMHVVLDVLDLELKGEAQQEYITA